MISPQDLRIGNRFNRELYTQRGMEYDPDFILTEQWMGILFTEHTQLALNDLNPIPLTEEWLMKFGVEVKDDNPKEKDHYKGDILFWIAHDNDLHKFEFTNSIIDGFTCYELGVNIKFIHQFQNLTFALTNKELQLK